MRVYVKEFFTFFDIMLTLAAGLVCLGFTIPHLARGATWLAIVAGMIAYALSEYAIHRYLFHLKPPRNTFLRNMLRRLHYDHHVHPNNLKLLFLPVWYSFPLIAVAGAIAIAVTSDWSLTLAAVTGVIAYLLYYEWVHFRAHRPIQPLTPWGRYMKKMHLWHHFKSEHFWFGVTNPVMDKVLGTYKDEKTVVRSETVRDLEKGGEIGGRSGQIDPK
ncbi:sterol desaturase family protein [Paenibacillus sp. OSY-SE]|uniref:sterol desaturase family protein n=1 Tax=Paenibacillus sp. OSY-SE TaxID=1196323 RepID=UPI0002F31A16|nr:sterol desaturase family protein [Paenibacillus sp. OSY-SE]